MNQNMNCSIPACLIKIATSEVIPIDELHGKVDEGMMWVEEAQNQVDAWWDGLTPIEQKNPVNIAKYETANRPIEKVGSMLSNLDGALILPKQDTKGEYPWAVI
jgi:hypothetical protein